MKLMRTWLRRLLGLFRRPRRDAEFAAELESHLQFHLEDNLRAGMLPEAARRDALLKLGGVEKTNEIYRDRRGLPALETLLQNLRFGVRMLLKSPGSTGAVVIALALGIGAGTAMFTVVRSVLGIMPAWFTSPAERVQLWTPIYHEESVKNMKVLDNHEFAAVGRLKAGVTEAQAAAELSLMVRQIHDQHLDDPFISKGANSRPLLEGLVGDIKTSLYVLLAATLCVLFIACLNVASLLVARSTTRQ